MRLAHLGTRPLDSKWSMSLPGVATRKSQRCELMRLRSDLMLVPPNTTCDWRLWNLSTLIASSLICDASSRVGEIIRHETSP